MAKARKVPSVQQMIGYPPHRLVVDGETYLVGFNDQDAKGRLEELINAQEWDRVYSEADRMKNGERHIKRHEQLISQGYYSTMGEGWRQVVLSPAGVFVFFLSLLQEHQPDLTLEDVKTLFEKDGVRCAHAIAAVAPDFFKAVLRQMGVPEEEIEKVTPDITKALSSLMTMQEPATVTSS